MSDLYAHNAFELVSSAPHTLESSTSSSSIDELAAAIMHYPLPYDPDTSSQKKYAEAFSNIFINDEYMGITSPYDDDGC